MNNLTEMVFDSRALRARRAAAAKSVQRAAGLAIRDTSRELEKTYEAAFKAAGLGKLGKAWSSKVLAPRGRERLPVGIVYPEGGERTRGALRAYGKGARIKARSGGGAYLWWPTGYNKVQGRRNERSTGARISTADMASIEGAFVIDAKGGRGVKLWCLTVAEAQKRNIRSGRVSRLAFAAGRAHLQVGTSRKKGAGFRSQKLLEQGFVPLFIGMPLVNVAERVDLNGLARPFPARLARAFKSHLDFGNDG